MCGIFGSINVRDVSGLGLQECLIHRGPDEQKSFQHERVFLYHARLAIQDLSPLGSQPMCYKNFVIVYNGEIYNHLELRKRYNLNCISFSDTETLLHLFDLLGRDMLVELDGMFALAIYDMVKKRIFVARDRAGEKPLYIYNDNKRVAFSSELNVLKSILPLEINDLHIREYIRYGFFYREHSPYKNVNGLLNGHFCEIDCTSLDMETECWWSIENVYLHKRNIEFTSALGEVDARLRQAVKRRLESSDLEVGTFLSGGIDSGIVTAIASEFKNSLKTFTVSFEGSYDESLLAKLVAEKYSTDHTLINISFENLEKDIEKIIVNYGEPFMDSSAIPSYYISMEAKKYVTVILTGDGADELFGGYRRYVPFDKFDFFKNNPLLQRSARSVLHLLPLPHEKKSAYNYFYRLINIFSRNQEEVYLSATTDIFYDCNDILCNDTYNSKLLERVNELNRKPLTGLNKLMLLDFETLLFSDLLKKMDIATMAHSLEGRSPFLSKELLELVPGLPDNYKIQNNTTKFLLRDLAKKYLPGELVQQPKRGFEIPLKSWINNELHDVVFDYLNDSNPLYLRYFNKNYIGDLLNKPNKFPAEKRAKMLYNLFCLEVWNKRVLRENIVPFANSLK